MLDDPNAPRQPLTITITATPPSRGVYQERPIGRGFVETERGGAEVSASAVTFVPDPRGASGDAPPSPVQLAVSIGTSAWPFGTTYHLDLTDLLEAIARAHFAAHPDEEPAELREPGVPVSFPRPQGPRLVE